MKQKTLSLQSRRRSFGFAFRGIAKYFQQEPNAWLHLVATVIVFIAAVYFDVSNNEMIVLIIVSALVWLAEIFNTVVERIMDFISLKQDPQIKFIKDLAAGAVLFAAITAVIVGAIIFTPKLF